MNKLRFFLDKIMETASIAIFVLMVLLVAFQVFMRYVLNSPSVFSESLTRYLFVWLVLITAAYACGKRDHMCITFLKDKLPPAGQNCISILTETLTLVFASCIMVYGGIRISAMQMVQLDSVLKIPTGVIYSIIPICGVGIAFYSICNIAEDIHALKTRKTPSGIQGGK